MENIVESTQHQAVAAWIDYLNQLRLDRLVAALAEQGQNLEAALNELAKIKQFMSNPEHILGSVETKHGEIAERMQVYFSNARRLVEGYMANHEIDSVPRTAPEDYLRDGRPIQSKFYNGIRGTLLNGIRNHFEKYPSFVAEGGSYDIPKDQFETIQRLLHLREISPSQLTKSDWKILDAIDFLEKETGLKFGKDIHASIVDYGDVQIGKADDTISREDSAIRKTDKQLKQKAYQASKPSIQEGTKVTAVGAATEGGIAFCMAIYQKRKEGKHLNDFTSDDWVDIGIVTSKNTAKGGIRGASIYALSNFTATPACVASALVSALFGVTAQAQALRRKEITEEDFILNSEAICMDVTISAISSVLGQTLIPIPVLGAIIGNATGMVMTNVIKQCNLRKEAALINSYCNELNMLNKKLDVQYQKLIEMLQENMRNYRSLMDFAFNEDVNKAFEGSIEFARFNGVAEDKIIKTKAELDAYFLL